MAEDHLAAPTPLEEHRKLAVFAGEWTGEEMVYPSRWTAGGPATSHVTARIDLNGFYLIQDTRQIRDGKETFATHGVFTYDREDRLYKLLWHDSLGYYPPSPASGGWSGKSLILVRGSLRGNARHVYEILDDNSYTMKIQFSPDAEGGPTCSPAFTGEPTDPYRIRAKAIPTMSILIDKNTKSFARVLPQERHLSFRSGDRLRHQDGRRHLAGKGGATHLVCRCSTPCRSAREDRRRCIRDLCAAARCRRRDLRSHRCRNSADRLHHRGDSGARHGAGEAFAVRIEIASDRPNCPG